MGLSQSNASALRRSRDALWAIWSFLLVLSVLAFLALERPDRVGVGIPALAWLSLACFVLALVAIRASGRRSSLSVPSIYLYVFGAFHLGLAPMLALHWSVPDFGDPSSTKWLSDRPIGEALFAVAVATLAFAIGVRVADAVRWPQSLTGRRESSASADRAAFVGLLTASAGVGGWFLFVFSRGGIGIFGGSYSNYLNATSGGPLPIIYLLLGLAGALSAVTPSHRLNRPALLLLALFALPALPLGLRGEVLFPLAGGLAVLAKRTSMRIKPLQWLIVVMLVLSGIAMIRTLRASGVVDSASSTDINPVHGLAELGYSLRPAAEAISWQSTSQPARGRTYIRPFQRALSRVAPAIQLPDSANDPYNMNVVVTRRVGPIGFSPVAEGIVNFGPLGAATFMVIVGMLLGWLERLEPTTSNLVLTGVILVPFLLETRNSFVSVPLQLAVGLIVWAAVFRPGSRIQAGTGEIESNTAIASTR